MALNICIEALIRLFFEIINFVFGDITLLFRGHPEAFWSVVLPELLRTISWIFIFFVLRYLIKVKLLANIVIIYIPLALGALASVFAPIPVLNLLISGTLLATAAILSAISWGFLTMADESIPFYLRLVGLPGMMVLGAISGATGGFLGILMDLGAVGGLSVIAKWVVPLSTLGVLLLTLWSPTWFCQTLNTSLILIEGVRQEGVVSTVGNAVGLMIIPLFLIKNRITKVKDKR